MKDQDFEIVSSLVQFPVLELLEECVSFKVAYLPGDSFFNVAGKKVGLCGLGYFWQVQVACCEQHGLCRWALERPSASQEQV